MSENAHAYTRVFDGRIRDRRLHNIAHSFIVDLNNIDSSDSERVLRLSQHNIDNNAYSHCAICEKHTMLYVHSTTAHFEQKTNLQHYIYDAQNRAVCAYKVCLKCYHALQCIKVPKQRCDISTIRKMSIEIRKFYHDTFLNMLVKESENIDD